MRELKFRAWERKKWVEDDFLDRMYLRMDGKVVWYSYEGFRILKEDEVDINFYIGLKDKNGVEIYEGDIIRYLWKKNPDLFKVVWDDDNCIFYGLVVSSDLPFAIGTCKYFFRNISHDVIEVVGNVYENPELIDKEERE